VWPQLLHCGFPLFSLSSCVFCGIKAVLCNVRLNQGFFCLFGASYNKVALIPLLFLFITVFLLSHILSFLFLSMFRSFRKKPVKEPVEEPVRKTSLPDIASQDVQWPEDLVDIAAIRHTPPPEPQLQGAAPISYQPDEPGTTSFHKPFRRFPGRSHDGGDRSISSIYMSHPPSSFHTQSGPAARISQRRTRVPPKFNLMVSGRSRDTLASCALIDCGPYLGCWRSRHRQDLPLAPSP